MIELQITFLKPGQHSSFPLSMFPFYACSWPQSLRCDPDSCPATHYILVRFLCAFCTWSLNHPGLLLGPVTWYIVFSGDYLSRPQGGRRYTSFQLALYIQLEHEPCELVISLDMYVQSHYFDPYHGVSEEQRANKRPSEKRWSFVG